MVLFIPRGDPADPTNSPAEFDATTAYLLRCGVTPLPSAHMSLSETRDSTPSLTTEN
jgi:hypothetical protein